MGGASITTLRRSSPPPSLPPHTYTHACSRRVHHNCNYTMRLTRFTLPLNTNLLFLSFTQNMKSTNTMANSLKNVTKVCSGVWHCSSLVELC